MIVSGFAHFGALIARESGSDLEQTRRKVRVNPAEITRDFFSMLSRGVLRGKTMG